MPAYLIMVPFSLALDSPLRQRGRGGAAGARGGRAAGPGRGDPVDARLERGRSLRDALRRLWEVESFDRILLPVSADERTGFDERDIAWILMNAPTETLALRPASGSVRARVTPVIARANAMLDGASGSRRHAAGRRRERRRAGRRHGRDRAAEVVRPGAQPGRPLRVRGAADRRRVRPGLRGARLDREHARVQLVLPAAGAHVHALGLAQLVRARGVPGDRGRRVSGLAASARRRATEAEQREVETALLADVATSLLEGGRRGRPARFDQRARGRRSSRPGRRRS